MTNNLSPIVFILALALPAHANASGASEVDASNIGEALVAQAEASVPADPLEPAGSSETETDAALAIATTDDDEDEKDKYELPFGVSVSTGLITSVGNLRPGLSANEQDNSLLNTWGFGVDHEFVDGFRGSINWGFYKYLTRAGGLNLQREARINDISVGLNYGPVYVIPRADIRISASLSGTVPISRMSRTSSLRTAISPGLSFRRSFGNLSLGYRLGATKRFHQFTSPVIDATTVDALRRNGGAEDISANEVALAGVNTEWTWSNGLSASYEWFDGFSTSLAWGYSRSWGYNVTECDELSSENARCNGRIARDSMTGSFSASYAFLDNYNVSLGVATGQRPKTDDNRRINFPFWDTQTPGLLRTQLSLDFSASF